MGLLDRWSGVYQWCRDRLRRGQPAAPDLRLDRRRQVQRTGYLEPEAFISVIAGLGRREREERLHVFSFSDFKRSMESKWERVKALIEMASDRIIKGHIDLDKDIYTRLDAETACLILPRASRQENRAKVAAIATDLATLLLGDAVLGGKRPQMVLTSLTLDAVLRSGDRGFDAIRAAVAAAGPALSPDALTQPDRLPAPQRKKLADMLDQVAADSGLGDTVNRATAGAGVAFGLDVEAAAKRSGEPTDWIDEQIFMRTMERLGKKGQMVPESTLSLVWTPTWVTGKRAIGAFHARVIRVDSDNAPALEGSKAYTAVAPIEALTLDRFVAASAAHELKNQFFSRERMGLTVPIHWMSLSPRWRDCIQLPFDSCPPKARRTLLKIEVFGLKSDIPASILGRLLQPLEKLGCDVLVRLPLSASAMIPSLRSAKAVGVDLSELENEERVGDDELFAKLEQFRDAARQARVACYVWGVRRRPLIARVVQIGYSLVNGPGVMCDIPVPRAPHSTKARLDTSAEAQSQSA